MIYTSKAYALMKVTICKTFVLNSKIQLCIKVQSFWIMLLQTPGFFFISLSPLYSSLTMG